MSKLIVQSHRGGGAMSPENTLESFIAAWEMGTIPEADLRTTNDGVIVAFHDADFSRVVKDAPAKLQKKGVADISYAQLSQLDVGSWQGNQFAGQRVCRMEVLFDALQRRPDQELYLDIKNVSLQQLAELARGYGLENRLILAAPSQHSLREWKALVPHGQTLLWMGGDEENLRNRFITLRENDFVGITQLQIHVHSLDAGFAPSLRFLREVADELIARHILFQTLPWEGEDTATYRKLLGVGVQSFASDYPEVALQALREWHQPKVLSLQEALEAARETKVLNIGEGILDTVPEVFKNQFGNQQAIIIADATTFEVAGRQVQNAFRENNHPALEPFIFPHGPHAEISSVEKLESALRGHQAIPVAVGSGVINDLTKLAAHRVGRPYLCVATADSMDGYTAFGASITFEGSKQTFACPAPVVVVADLQILRDAPREMTASGYADLHAKVTAGADWIVADALGVEPIDPMAWNIVHGKLRPSLSNPQGAAEGEREAITLLTEGLMLGGFAMQWSRSSRPASGAEHQFSHLWDMQHHTHENGSSSHGFKVGIGTLAVTALYEYLLKQPFDQLDVERCCDQWSAEAQAIKNARELLGEKLADLAERETRAKYCNASQLRLQLESLKKNWPDLKVLLQKQLFSFDQVQQRLRIVGAPYEPEQIGISRTRLRRSFYQAACIRRRFTVFDLALRTGTLNAALDEIFGDTGQWPERG